MSSASEQQEIEGFRSREEELKRRHEIRRKIMEEYELRKAVESKPCQDSVEYQRLSRKLVSKDASDGSESLDMFASQDSGNKKVERKEDQQEVGMTDEANYYKVIVGKVVGGKYQIVDKIGKGVFGVVSKAKVVGMDNVCALKIIRKNQMMCLSGEREFQLLSSLRKCDSVISMSDYFHEDGHLFLVCELMGPDLRSFTHRNQNKITLENIKQYAISMFMSLHELRKHKIIHADIKPDNFLMTPDLAKIKLSDFGTAYRAEQHSFDLQYLVARYYRPPEIILGCAMPLEHRYSIDTWAVGCSLYQLYTGQFLFAGDTNNQMLRFMMETRGKFSSKMLRKCNHWQKHFDENFNFLCHYPNKNVKEPSFKKIQVSITPERELMNLLKKHSPAEEGTKQLFAFKQFLERCLMLNPRDRLTPAEAFIHPFLNYQIKLN